MGTTEIEAEIALLLEKLESRPHDIYEIQLQLLASLNEMRAFGMPLPADLVKLEAALEEDLAEKPLSRSSSERRE